MPYDAVFDVAIPLCPETDSATNVAAIVQELLRALVQFDHRASHSDVLQALSIVTAVRTATADVSKQQQFGLSIKLLGIELGDHDDMRA